MATVWAFIRATSKGKVNLRFRITRKKGEVVFYTSKLTIFPDQWDTKKQGVKAKVIFEGNKADFDKRVIEYKELLNKIAESTTEKLSSAWMDQQVDKVMYPQKYEEEISEKAKPNTLFKWIDQFLKTAVERKNKNTGRILVYNNIQQYKATYKHLKDFSKSKKRRDFQFEEIDLQFYESFVNYLQKLNFTANSVGKHIKVLKLILNEAARADININDKYKIFKVYTEETDTIYLNEKELEKLKKADFSTVPHLDRVRDWFLLLAWTGCRFSDLGKIGETEIKANFITFRQQKTTDRVKIPLHPIVSEILRKYDFQLPRPVTNQKFNLYIKDIAKKVGLSSPETFTRTVGGKKIESTHPKYALITTHTGRRSFATNMYKRGLPTLMIMSVTGHRTEKSFLKYIKVKQDEHAEMMAKAWAKIYK